MSREDDKAEMLRLIEHAPVGPFFVAPDLIGWEAPSGLLICVQCAARIMGRGCRLPVLTRSIWRDVNDEKYSSRFECDLHEPIPPLTASHG